MIANSEALEESTHQNSFYITGNSTTKGMFKETITNRNWNWFGLDLIDGVKHHFHLQISVISSLSVLLVEETWVPGENHWPVASH